MSGVREALTVCRRVLAGAIVVLLVASAAGVAAASTDRRALRFLPRRTTVAGIQVGGLSPATAIALVRRQVEAPLHRPLTVTTEGFQTTTSPWDVGWRVDAAAAVHKVMHDARHGGFTGRLWHRWFGNDRRTVALRPRWVAGRSEAVLKAASGATLVAPVPARLDTSSGWVNVEPDQPGRMLDLDRASRALSEAAQRGDSRVTLPTKATLADVRAGAFSTVILVRTGENVLHLYQEGQIVKTYPVATGQSRYPTPTGTWRVVQKLVNPIWTNPNSEWSRNMPARIGPGRTNPLGSHALALSAPGILIHATPDSGSIGFSVSHGCIRMLDSDEQDLFSRVSSGVPVAIVAASPPKARTAARPPGAGAEPVAGAPVGQPAPAGSTLTPEQQAAAQF